MSTPKSDMDINISKRSKMARGYAEIDQQEAAKNLSVSVVTLSRYENGKRVIGVDVAKKMADLYRVRLTWLLTGEGPMLEAAPPLQIEQNVASYHDYRPSKRVPVISWVQAGDFVDPIAPTTPGYSAEWQETSATMNENAFALRIYGDSMEPEFHPGDIIVIDPGRQPENGQYVVAKNGDEEATFKQFVRDGSRVYLKPLNGSYPTSFPVNLEHFSHSFFGLLVTCARERGPPRAALVYCRSYAAGCNICCCLALANHLESDFVLIFRPKPFEPKRRTVGPPNPPEHLISPRSG